MTATTATLTRLLAWRPGGYLRASGVLFGWLALRVLAQLASGCWRPLWRNPCLQ